MSGITKAETSAAFEVHMVGIKQAVAPYMVNLYIQQHLVLWSLISLQLLLYGTSIPVNDIHV